ncbi:hypothetical protein MMG00_12730 [Ignatzschineria rhizosphaerae]|uniref:Uncharacterized protein n=1 Tax=Ignatzschineria rhizosphaerae TaxID=2923279 RepID=A0ABY3X5M2_9GAMM|nr:hypothetical protein [Ignatzschineria rhizosphaerae]UNM96046.1 hypothetical protein MMG00_12730 [Ignatzschineria rhizosphaerae]
MRVIKEIVKLENVKFAHLSKAENLKEYIKECDKNNYNLESITSIRSLYFTDKSAYQDFTNNLLLDRDCLENIGGFDEAAIVYFNNEPQFVIVTEGYSYARYIGLIN